MENLRSFLTLTLILCASNFCNAQQATCYGGGSIAASVIITVLVILILAGIAYYAWKRYGKYKKGQHLILETDPEKGSEYVFDNPGFKDASLTTPAAKEPEKPKVDGSSNKAKWSHWSTLTSKNEKRKTQDDSILNQPVSKSVTLRSYDFTGLGFNICGNMRDGIYIKDILHHGPASESGKLNPGDRITSITINFENMVFDDALTILSYASPYEVTLEAKGAKLTPAHVNTYGQPTHPLYKSSSSVDLLQIGKSAKKRLFQAENSHNQHTPPQKTEASSPKKASGNKKTPSKSAILNTDQLKNQLEQKILEDHNENLRQKQQYDKTVKSEVQRTSDGNKYQKFGIRVLPMEQKEQKTSPKSAELSQNDNNINIERNEKKESIQGVDEVDKKNTGPPVKKREKKFIEDDVDDETFVRKGSLNSSGIKRDINGIPQEIPNHMMNAAVAARRNRKADEKGADNAPKRQKGKAPAPPLDESLSSLDESLNKEMRLELVENPPTPEVKTEVVKDYHSDSEEETDNQSSVNTIELNSSDITIHQAEEIEEQKQNRRTASTGDLSKLQKNRKTSSGTLERAQSLDITDTGMPVINKKHENFDTSSGDSLYGNALIDKEPRLSLILDGLNTFQRSRLKKSTEWGNLEDAILNLNSSSVSDDIGSSRGELDSSSGEFGPKSTAEFDALVNKINEIKQETSKRVEEQEKVLKDDLKELEAAKNSLLETMEQSNRVVNRPDDEISIQNEDGGHSSFVSDVLNAVTSLQKETGEEESAEESSPVNVESRKEVVDPMKASSSMLLSERDYCSYDYYPRKIEEDTNVSDDIKVSRHSLGSLERPKLPEIRPKPTTKDNVSNVSVSDKYLDIDSTDSSLNTTPRDGDTSELYKTALDDTVKNEDQKSEPTYGKVLISTPDLIKNVTITEAINDLNNEVTIEGPTSLTFEIPARAEAIDTQAKMLNNGNSKGRKDENKSSSLTYITEIQVSTPARDVSEVEVITPNVKNLDSEFENYVKNFEITDVSPTSDFKILQRQKSIPDELDAAKELTKIREMAEEQLKKLPELRFTTSSYEPAKIPEKRRSQIELLRSNFEKSPPKKPEIKSRIPIATNKTPPTSPERRDSRNLDFEVDTDLIEMMTSGIHSTPKYAGKNGSASRNVTVTSIRNSKIPSGLPTFSNRPPVPPRRSDSSSPGEGGVANVVQLSTTNGSSEGGDNSSFKQWVFNPSDSSVTNITVVSDSSGNTKGVEK